MCPKCNLKKIDLISIMPQALKITRYEVNMQCNTSRCPNTAPDVGKCWPRLSYRPHTSHCLLYPATELPPPAAPWWPACWGEAAGPSAPPRGQRGSVSTGECLRVEERAQSAGLRRGRCCGARPPPAKVTPLSHPGPGPVSSAQLGDGALQVH